MESEPGLRLPGEAASVFIARSRERRAICLRLIPGFWLAWAGRSEYKKCLCGGRVERNKPLRDLPSSNTTKSPSPKAWDLNGCFRHRVLLRRQLHSPIVRNDQDRVAANTDLTFHHASKTIVDEKISLNVSRRSVSPAWTAGVLTSDPNCSAL